MSERAVLRIADIKDRIAAIRALLAGKSAADIERDRVVRAALERFVEVISEASRHLPEAWKAEHEDVPWRRVADIGNIIRHAYDAVDLPTLWAIYERDLDPLEAAIDAMLTAHAPGDPSP
jgi:uncharacterized protein with HEPN domain